MSRVANKIIDLPQGVTATVANQAVTVKGAKGTLSLPLKTGVSIEQKEKQLQVKFADELSRPQAGCHARALANMILGVTKGYEKKLELQGVGYRAAVQGKVLNLDARLLAPGELQRAGEASRSRRRARRKSSSRASIGRRSARLPPRSATCVRPSPTRARACRYVGEKIELKEGKKK